MRDYSLSTIALIIYFALVVIAYFAPVPAWMLALAAAAIVVFLVLKK